MSDYRALYRKWRPRDFDDVCGQDGITDILKYEVENSRLSHAYLFCGSRGTGKTSCAKILAKAVNCENPRGGNPCNACAACRSIDAGVATDVIEMDAASNNGIGDVRDMQDEIAFTPAILKYRVYIIDEVHMMSGQAFNALLKTLEEPPEYVIFILATTEYHKLPTTIVSRCQRFDFKRIASDIIISRLLKIAEAEKIRITEDAARVIARVARGGMRDAVSLLELCAGAHTEINEELVFSTVGSGNKASAYKIIEAVGRSDFSTVYSIIDDITMKSGDVSVFWQEIIDAYRDLMVVKSTDKAKAYLDLTDLEYASLSAIAKDFTMSRLSYHVTILENAIADMQRAFNSKRSIAEIALTRMCDPRLSGGVDALLTRVEELERELAMIKLGAVPTAPSIPQPTETQRVSVAVPVEKKPEPKPEKPDVNVDEAADRRPYDKWKNVVARIAELKPPLSVGLAGAVAEVSGRYEFTVMLAAFFAKRLKENEQDALLVRGAIAEAEGIDAKKITLNIVASEPKTPVSDLDMAFGQF